VAVDNGSGVGDDVMVGTGLGVSDGSAVGDGSIMIGINSGSPLSCTTSE
jgi:carbonic anhydrase/acetyltransferase-like protein (isoleucine patch superfamily)